MKAELREKKQESERVNPNAVFKFLAIVSLPLYLLVQ